MPRQVQSGSTPTHTQNVQDQSRQDESNRHEPTVRLPTGGTRFADPEAFAAAQGILLRSLKTRDVATLARLLALSPNHAVTNAGNPAGQHPNVTNAPDITPETGLQPPHTFVVPNLGPKRRGQLGAGVGGNIDLDLFLQTVRDFETSRTRGLEGADKGAILQQLLSARREQSERAGYRSLYSEEALRRGGLDAETLAVLNLGRSIRNDEYLNGLDLYDPVPGNVDRPGNWLQRVIDTPRHDQKGDTP